jgi:hypothetical protein
VIYYFPGLEPLATGDEILQPVLRWFAGSWQMASWNCCYGGNQLHSAWIDASPGDSVYGYVLGTNCFSGVCHAWQVYSLNNSTGGQTWINTDSRGEPLDWALGGVIEAYNIDNCSQYPAGTVTFSDITVLRWDHGWIPVTPRWNPRIGVVSPVCLPTVLQRGAGIVTITMQTTP